MDRYYRITKTFPREYCESEWQLSEGDIVQDVGSNMFICSSEKRVIETKGNCFQQMDSFEKSLLKLYINNGIHTFFTEIK